MSEKEARALIERLSYEEKIALRAILLQIMEERKTKIPTAEREQ